VDELISDAEVDWRTERLARFAAVNVLGALAPSNFPLTNPVVLRDTVDRGGVNLAHGARRLASDLSRSPHSDWLGERSGGLRRPARALGNRRHRALAAAPGGYIHAG
jgi:poly(3-hydroxyalkanoate) synthetase